MKNRIIILSVMLLTTLGVMAQKTIYGVVTNEKGEPMPFASLFIEDMKKGVIADSEGRYSVLQVPDGKHTVRASFIGYETVNTEVDMQGRDVVANFKLKEETVSLEELFILPKGMDFPTYIMRQVEKNIKPLKKRVSSYDCTTTATLTKHINLSELKKRRTIRFALMMLSWAKIFDIMVKYPDFSVQMQENVQFRNGSMKSSKLKVLKTTPKLTDRELESVMKKDWFLDKNPYDGFYDIVQKKIKELKSKKSKYKLKYCGSYEENGKNILIVEYGRTHIEVVDGLWQIRRMRYKSGSRTISFEFHPLVPGVYLPTSGYAEYIIDYEGYPKGKVNIAMGLAYRNVKKR